MNILKIIQQGQIFLIPLFITLITQIIKVSLDFYKKKEFKISYFVHYGGMPSAHTALFISLATIILLNYGWQSPLFAMAFILCLIMIRDALGIRHHLGNHGLILKQLIQELYERKHTKIKHDKIVTVLGHTPWQVFVGAILGFSLTVIFFSLIN